LSILIEFCAKRWFHSKIPSTTTLSSNYIETLGAHLTILIEFWYCLKVISSILIQFEKWFVKILFLLNYVKNSWS
jgi:hypothetical protein